MSEDKQREISKKQAENHVSWFLGAIKPLLIDFYIHGFKHGIELSQEKGQGKNDPSNTRMG